MLSIGNFFKKIRTFGTITFVIFHEAAGAGRGQEARATLTMPDLFLRGVLPWHQLGRLQGLGLGWKTVGGQASSSESWQSLWPFPLLPLGNVCFFPFNGNWIVLYQLYQYIPVFLNSQLPLKKKYISCFFCCRDMKRKTYLHNKRS